MGGVALTTNVHHLVLDEPRLGLTYPPGSIDRIEALWRRVTGRARACACWSTSGR
jgi:hypothetical protein